DAGAELVVSAQPLFAGRIWRLNRSMSTADLLAVGIDRKTASVVWRPPAACLSDHRKFRGTNLCVAPGTVETLQPPLDRNVAALSIPPSLSVKAFYKPGAKGRGVTFRSDTDISGIRQQGMTRPMRSVLVARTTVDCSTSCPIPTTDAYDLAAIFDKYWTIDTQAFPQVLL